MMMNTVTCEKEKRHCGIFEGKMYSKFVFPRFLKPSKGKNSEEKESLDKVSVSGGSNNNRCIVVSSNIDTVAKTLERKDHNWVVQTSVPSDLIVQIGDSSFHLHKLPMVSRSGYLNRLVFQRSNGERDNSHNKIQLDNLPGGVEIFELVVKFCYGLKVDLSSSNIAPLYCAAHFLEMSDDLEQGNLVSKAEAFLSFLVFSSWKDTFQILKSCETISLWAKELQILKICSESIALKACTNLKDVGSGIDGSKLQSVPSEVEEDAEIWWFEDISRLRIDHFIEVIQSMKDKGMKPNLVGSCVAQWTTKWLSQVTFGLDNSTPDPKSMAHQLQKVTTECLIRVIPAEENSVTCNFLLHLLKAGLAMQISSVLLETLEQRIARMIEQCRVPDLLVKNYGCDESVYDVRVVVRAVEAYVAFAAINVIRPKILAVGRLVDSYLVIIARDENVSVESFTSLAQALPKDARYCDDNLYRATDMYLKAHPNLTEEGRTSLCRFLEYHRLSQEARDHVMKNNRLPLKFSTRFILLEQVNITTRLKTSVGPNHQRTKTRAIIKANNKSLVKGWISSQKEIKKMTKEVETMKSQLNDLQKCKLKLLGQLKRCVG